MALIWVRLCKFRTVCAPTYITLIVENYGSVSKRKEKTVTMNHGFVDVIRIRISNQSFLGMRNNIYAVENLTPLYKEYYHVTFFISSTIYNIHIWSSRYNLG
jgi:hypothetical protein